MTAHLAPIASRSAAAWRRTSSTDGTRAYPRAGKRSRSPAGKEALDGELPPPPNGMVLTHVAIGGL